MTSDPAKFFQQTVKLVVQYFHSEESPCSLAMQRGKQALFGYLSSAGIKVG